MRDTARVDPQIVRYGERPVRIDREKDRGEYGEPNLWIIHQVSPAADVT